MSRRSRIPVILALIAAAAPHALAIPPRPEQIDFPPLRFEPPAREDFRHVIRVDGGEVPVYLAESHEFPLIDVVFTFRGGRYLDPPQQTGLARATAAMMRRGGTGSVAPDALDERLDFLATTVTARAGDTQSTVSLNSLVRNFEESLELFMDIVRRPGFDAGRLSIYKDERLERMKQRNDHPARILAREWDLLLWGREYYPAARPTAASLESIGVNDLRRMHGRIFHPANLIIAVSGDFETEAMLRRLEAALSGWSRGEPAGRPPQPATGAARGLYHVEKAIPQGRVRIGHRTIRRDHPDYFPMLVMNRILGGGGFTSRIVSRVRSDEGLAYHASSRFVPAVWHPGVLRASVESRNRTVALSMKLILEEIERIRREPVDAGELETARSALIETFPRRFESRAATLAVFVNDELTGREPGYWRTYRDRVRNVTAEDVRRAAREHLRPEDLLAVVVGPWEAIAPGDLEGRASMDGLFGGAVTHLPPRDPLTLEPES